METNFFSAITPLLDKGISINLNLMKVNDDLVVSFKPGTTNIDDQSLNNLKPIILTHPAKALDEGFFETINSPIESLVCEAEKIKSFEEQVKGAAEKSKAKKDADVLKSKEQIENDKKASKATEILIEADALLASNNFTEALNKYLKASTLCPADESIKKSIERTKDMMIVPIIDKASNLQKAGAYKECIAQVKKARELNPLHHQLKELENVIIGELGQSVFNQLTQNQ